MSKVAFIDFHNVSPHIETSFELAKRHLDLGDEVHFHFLGHDVPYLEHYHLGRFESLLFRRWMPEQLAARLIKHPRLNFVGRAVLPIASHRFTLPDSMEALKGFEYRGADVGMGVASSLISRTKNSHFDPSKNSKVVADALAGSMAVYDYAHALLSEVKPDKVYIFNGRLCHPRAALRAAQHLGIPVGIHDRGADTTKFFEEEFSPHDRKRVQELASRTWAGVQKDPGAIEKAKAWYQERRDGRPRDWYSFTSRQVRSLLPDLAPGKRVVTYFSSSDDEFAAIGESYSWVGWDDQLHAAKGLIDVALSIEDVQLVIRLHPHLTRKHPDDLRRWLSLGGLSPSLTILAPESPVDTYALLDASDVVVTGGSTVGIEAVHWGRPSVLMGPSEYDAFGAVHIAQSREAVEKLLRTSKLSVEPASALPYGYHRATFGKSFQYFQANGLTTGRLLGKDIHQLPPVPSLLSTAKVRFLERARSALGHL